LKDERWWIRRGAVLALENIESEKVIQPLVDVLADEESRVCEAATKKLLEIGNPAIEPLVKAMKDEKVAVRMRAATTLGKIKSVQAIPPLVEALHDNDWMARYEAAVALVKINSQESVEPVIELLKSENNSTREEVAWIRVK